MNRRTLILAVLLLSLVVAVPAQAGTVYYTFVTEFGMDAKLQAKYDYASCTGLRNRGSKSLNTAQYGWIRGYRQFNCAYDTPTRSCYDAVFEADVVKSHGRWGNWYPHMLMPGSCYSR